MMVEVYYNLNKKIFSIRDHKTKKVIAYSQYVQLKNCKFKVSEAGRQRVLKEKRKNVHAWVLGELHSTNKETFKNLKQGYYDPYLYDSFVDVHSLEPLKESEFVVLEEKKIFYR